MATWQKTIEACFELAFFFSRNVNVLVSSAAAAIKAFVASSSHNSTVRSRDKDSKYRCDYRRLL